ncbi:hypothetical protein RV134_310198 [Roseovarius sp. EC-HK134]|nr:hypothetical protein RV420_360305 [Roseovarius sp. EC-SD190]VVT20314.1 hypothetical protein RV134_310198 [Roseovarius sp. EC-HK134]
MGLCLLDLGLRGAFLLRWLGPMTATAVMVTATATGMMGMTGAAAVAAAVAAEAVASLAGLERVRPRFATIAAICVRSFGARCQNLRCRPPAPKPPVQRHAQPKPPTKSSRAG